MPSSPESVSYATIAGHCPRGSSSFLLALWESFRREGHRDSLSGARPALRQAGAGGDQSRL